MLQACRKSSLTRIAATFAIGLGVMSSTWGAVPVHAAANVELYTPYLSLSAPPGDSISYQIDLINHGSSTETVDLGFQEVGNNWKYDLTAGGRNVSRIAVKAGETETINLALDVPLEVNKGAYNFQVKAGGEVLPITVQVSEQGTFRSDLSLDQPNMQGHADSTFTYSATLRNRTADKQTYALTAQTKPGWDITFVDGSTNVTSVEVEPNGEKSVQISVKPPENVAAGTYKIPIAASNNSTSANATIEAAITGTYGLKLSTPNDLLSTDVTAGAQRKLDLTVTNTGSSEMKNVSLSADTPSGWEVTFSPSKLDALDAGEVSHVQATIKADKKALAGDYVVGMTASSPEKTASADFRVAVKSSTLWGWIGILIIVAVAGGLFFLFRKFGRR
ncbi:hypothetical protein PCCS19_02940 [Paenibacillus sp. CCS19]|uniref:COG1470 family protein n=1 Tax=Paenibacillus sp. CCS19 TaxID=3158387 RepID=UPI0025630E45|nr:NEW3 domain-containing protein [Paenibacillus cellulosilyticus]GMK37241.1 hypothetical protein PCCS19_02940 [Paenibacillus cellulosilyticus]